MLRIEDLRVAVDGREVLKGVNLELGASEIALLLGPNGSGKSSLIQTLLGNPKYRIKSGRILLDGRDITDLPANERAALGLGAVFQMPPKLRGIKLRDLLRRLAERSGADYQSLMKMAEEMGAAHLLDRDLHVGFSGGEVKRAEVLLLAAQRPRVALLDEPDSGVDLDSLPVLGKSIRSVISQDGDRAQERRSALVVTHTGHIAKYLQATRAFIMVDGVIKCYGDAQAILRDVEKYGFEGCLNCIFAEVRRD